MMLNISVDDYNLVPFNQYKEIRADRERISEGRRDKNMYRCRYRYNSRRRTHLCLILLMISNDFDSQQNDSCTKTAFDLISLSSLLILYDRYVYGYIGVMMMMLIMKWQWIDCLDSHIHQINTQSNLIALLITLD